MRKEYRSAGFTLIELMIVTALMGVLMLSVYAVFSSGVRIWKRINVQTKSEDVAILFQKLGTDVRNGTRFGKLPFMGEEDHMSFPCLFNDSRSAMGFRMGVVTYSYESRAGTLVRQRQGISDIYEEKPGERIALLEGVDSAQFKYYFFDPEENGYGWIDEWPPDSLTEEPAGNPVPVAVRLEITLNEYAGQGHHIKTIALPLGM